MKRKKHNVIDTLVPSNIPDVADEWCHISTDDDIGDYIPVPEDQLPIIEEEQRKYQLDAEIINELNRTKVKNEFIGKYLGENYLEKEVYGKTWYNYDSSRIWINQEKKLFSPQIPNIEIVIGTEREYDSGEELILCIKWEDD